ncbi:gamma-glutamyl-gamma-aminobutyrate hydrolase family protein [Photobacterium sp. DA100]|uniref:gamma-glutamyl-gamma-aminobutyrate hydrolase family protein n=1 Tax=Photobacterium sp. DA100 TaxID=3027472 RepID=UPI0024787930|nr:gamma-glutamyl-gamma-aminobutyrate hydrolase family protein [Photobacterium sp. DA100]WEM43769.1 gamma-glutamyl-gamma-aminobutyrate hydrolase family protein [Photobacterium sp. DA100]
MNESPVIAIACCEKKLSGYAIQSVNQFYIDAVTDFGGIPVLLPATAKGNQLTQLLNNVDGILLPGSHSNVAPHRYGAEHDEAMTDEGRDELVFQLIEQAVEKNIPTLGICRGFQEINVALGGSLYPFVHHAGFNDHREDKTDDFNKKYAARHSVMVEHGGHFSQWLNEQREIPVNTLHNQGINLLAPGLRVEACATDGLIEAISLDGHPYFIGVQWHPEWQARQNQFSQFLFKHFIMASSQRNGVRLSGQRSDR